MALPHAAPGDPLDIRPLGEELAGARSTALFKSRDLELIRLVLPAGRALPEHRVAGELTLQCLEGRLRVQAPGVDTELAAGRLLWLGAGVVHRLDALDDSSALLTIALPAAAADGIAP